MLVVALKLLGCCNDGVMLSNTGREWAQFMYKAHCRRGISPEMVNMCLVGSSDPPHTLHDSILKAECAITASKAVADPKVSNPITEYRWVHTEIKIC